ncbi:probable malonyl-CoA-acyl carrier protein transacylase, mitochondrial isoform X2 [Halyomorpha halys]|nr:probable malonyl-CoA-acyl carrier protein transacylase, mitochondrial isoform X2 [Halyomorpha halys]
MNSDVIKFPSAKDLFDRASSILGYDLKKLCLQGPAEKLNKTVYAQPAILVCSLAALERLKEEKPRAIENCIATAGFSLGEISALVLAEVLSFEKAVKLVKIRAEAMQFAAEMEKGAMVTVLYGPDSKLSEACKKAKEHAETCGVTNAHCGISNYLFPHCKIVGGNEEAIKYLEDNKNEFKLRKLKRLPVSGAFHTPLMKPASEVFYKAMKKANLSDPIIAVHSNIDGKHYENAEHIRRVLAKQIVAPVKWEQTLHVLYERPQDMPFPKTYECGPGNSLSTILKMVNSKAWQECFNVKS